MSLIIAIHVSDGLVMASDSRITYSTTSTTSEGNISTEVGVHITDTTPKTFVSPNRVGISYCGDSTIKNKPITGFVESFIEEHKDGDVDEIKDSIIPYFRGLEANLDTTFIIGGYQMIEGLMVQRLFRINTLSNNIEIIETTNQGALWSGVTDILSRAINPVYVKNEDDSYSQIPQFSILWKYFTLQDAIDFARYAIKTTIDTMSFQSRVKTVGGPIDILVIKPTEAFWIEKRQLH